MEFDKDENMSAKIDSLSESIIRKMDEAETRRDREFMLKLKELDFYKNNYTKELRDIFDYWFDIVRITHIKDNEHISEQERTRYEKKLKELLYTDTVSKYKMNTLKYGGPETGRILAMENKLHQSGYCDQPPMTALYIWCAILCVLKKEILGQDLSPIDVIQVMVNDFDENEESVIAAKKYIRELYIKTYDEIPYWA